MLDVKSKIYLSFWHQPKDHVRNHTNYQFLSEFL